jgi:hydrogenase expression/formation protein HypC
MKIKKITGDFAKTQTAGLTRTINIQMLPGIKIGDYVLVHAGFAIHKLDPKKAKETLKLIDEIRR